MDENGVKIASRVTKWVAGGLVSFTDTPRLTKQVAKGASIAFVGGIAGRFISLGLQILLGRVLGPEAYGLYALGRGITGIVHSVASLGLPNAVVRFAAMYRGEGDKARIKGILAGALLICVGTNVLASFVLVMFSEKVAKNAFDQMSLSGILQILALALPFNGVTTVAIALPQAFRQIEYQVGIKNIFQPLMQLMLTSFAFLVGLRLYGAVYAFLSSSILGAFLSLYFIHRVFPEFWTNMKPVYEMRRLLRFSLPLVPVSLSYFLLMYTDRIILGLFEDSSAVGIYAAAATLSMTLALVHIALVTIFAPIISDLYHRGELEQLNQLYRIVTRWDTIFTLAGFAILSLFSKEILGLYGANFVDGSPMLGALLIGYVLSAMVGPTGKLLQMAGKQDIELLNSFIMIGLNIVLDVLLVSIYGGIGAAIATALSFSFINIVQLVEIKKMLRMNPFCFFCFGDTLPIAVGSVILVVFSQKSYLMTKFVVLFFFLVFIGVWLYRTRTEGDRIILQAIANRVID